MVTNSPLARKSTEAIERLYITMRHLFYRGSFRVSGNSGNALRDLLLRLNPEIYGSISDPNKVELDGLNYVLDRLPQGIEECVYINLTAAEGYNDATFEVIVPAKRRRNCYRIDEEQMNIEVSRGRSEIYDVLTHLTFFYHEADKIRDKAIGINLKKPNRLWQKLEEFIFSQEPVTDKARAVALMHLSDILGRTYEEVHRAHESFSMPNKPDRLFHVVYWMGRLSQLDALGEIHREIAFTATLISQIGHHATGEKWANQIKKVLYDNNLIHRPLHIISSNMHSVMNMLFAHHALGETYVEEEKFSVYEKLSSKHHKALRQKVNEYATKAGMLKIEDTSGANINVQIIDLQKLDLKETAFSEFKSKDAVLLVMDYAFGEQAFEVMDELLKPYKAHETRTHMKVESISIMGKAGILEGQKGDIIVPTSHVFEGTADNYPFHNELTFSDFCNEELGVYQGMMITVLGTSLQNKDLLHFFRDTSWGCVGLEMEGAHYHKAIQIASKIRGHIQPDIKVRYAYYASDNPLETGSTLASGGLGLTGVRPTYLITKKIIEQILKD
ncbi:hypothetical protein EQP59_02530 [Ornithobacterium rhinotracheale]|uniref:Uncharacterized protein n=1 Tax=Ornithobacterium rhinotracheale TaxID=28251 RepID=A0A3R5UUV0_ORNRH|nr:hypothetical protein [Ornithobacterium rhinotracheale]QAR30314.1 hypothetical protein EQP59_02530 [Ornithobacterium rhinotracheale]